MDRFLGKQFFYELSDLTRIATLTFFQMKVLLFSNDLMPFSNLPTSGGGLRCFQLMRGLESHGIEVIASMPAFTYLTESNLSKIPPEQKEYLWHFGEQDEIYKRVNPDAVLFASNWDHFDLRGKISVPLIIDLHGSRMIETKLFGNQASSEKKVSVLSRADCLLTAGTRQRSYFYGWLVQAGRVPEDEHFIRYIPISLSPELPQRIENNDQFPCFVTGGGWFPWQNQAKAIFTIANAIERKNQGLIKIYGTPHQEFGGTTEERLIQQLFTKVKELSSRSERIQCNGYIGREELIQIYTRAHVAIEAMEYNIERELAFTTRTVEYLWCGLPVIYNNYSELSEHISEFDAGWTVDPTSVSETERVIEEIFNNPDLVKKKSENASRLVRERFTWDKTILPLVNFLNAPKKVGEGKPVLGLVYARPSFLSARGDMVDVPMVSTLAPLIQRFIVPAENISAIEIPVSILKEDAKDIVREVEFVVSRKTGGVLIKKSVPAQLIPQNGPITLYFPFLKTPEGGEELTLTITLRLKVTGCSKVTDSPVLSFGGLSQLRYPFLEDAPLLGRNSRGEEVYAQSLALSFVPGDYTRMYQLNILLLRAMRMVKEGEWRRLKRAVVRRIPQLISKIKARAFSEV